jgi:glycosyltransferase involved in cell wall biosynthesis
VPLWIAGDGPQAEALRGLAAGDDRIRFLGRLTDDELVEHYSRAAVVPFVPELEDMGLITLEAMACGKPVLTVTDAGGVTEFVEDGVNGRIVAPDEKALARALDDMLADRDKLHAMGQAALKTATGVTWQRTARALLDAAHAGPPSREVRTAGTPPAGGLEGAETPSRPRLLVVNTFGVFPPDSGGKKRMFFLYRGLSNWADVTLLNLGSPGSSPEVREFSPSFREVRVPPDEGFLKQEAALTRALRKPVTDIAALLHADQLGSLRETFVSLSRDADVVVAAHVYLYPLVEALWDGPVWYDAHNVEADMKADVLELPRLAAPFAPDTGGATPSACLRAVEAVAAVEARLVRHARRVLAVSDLNRQRFEALYERPAHTLDLVPNGTHLPDDAWLDGERRESLKRKIGFGSRPLAVFVASYHGPNLEAVQAIVDLAPQCPEWEFGVAGSVCQALSPGKLPHNVHALGVLTEAELTALLRAADVGLNPMRTGSGTNLKLLDYTGHGALVVTTPVGARGLAFVDGEHLVSCELSGFADALRSLATQVPGPQPALRAAARAVSEQVYGWDSIAQALAG